ncbi:MAG: hypothetical protein ABIO92_05415 [Chloroflexia bacterium]
MMSNSDPNQPSMEQPASEQVLCPNCNGGNPPGAANCTWCGKPMDVSDTTEAPPGAATAAAIYTPAPSATQQQGYQSESQPYQPQATGYTQPTQETQPAQPGYTDAPQYPQPAPVVTAPPPAKSGSGRKIALIVGGVLLGLLLLCGILFGSLFAGVMGLTQPAVDAGEKFMAALRDGNYDRAFELSTPSLQQEVGDAQMLRDALESKQPTKWSFTSRNIQNDIATLGGTTTYANNEPGQVEMELRKVGNDWMVSFINLK